MGKKITNSKGSLWYGLHFYPGVAEYRPPDKDPFRVFLNENTIRQMDPTFAGRPVFVQHVDGVNQNVNELRGEADGWVVESFFNKADGKHWVKFIVVSEKGEQAIRHGFKLSNCYIPKDYAGGGVWNGVDYDKEIVAAEYEHLAIVNDPRYAESEILTPEQFKAYNERKLIEIDRLSNTKEKENSEMKLFKKQKIENSLDLEGTHVILPKSGKEMSLANALAVADETEAGKGKARVANAADEVAMGEGKPKMTVGDLVGKYQQMCDELEKFKSKNVSEDDEDDGDPAVENAEEKEVEETEEIENISDDEAAKKKALELAEHEEKEIAEKKKNETDKKKADEKAAAKAKADALRNAHETNPPTVNIVMASDKIAKGKELFGS